MKGFLSFAVLAVLLLVHSSQAVYVQVSFLLFNLLVLQVQQSPDIMRNVAATGILT